MSRNWPKIPCLQSAGQPRFVTPPTSRHRADEGQQAKTGPEQADAAGEHTEPTASR